jgi:ethanolamine utilization protein EutN
VILGRVIGEVWATRRHAALDGRKLLIVKPHLVYAGSSDHFVAVDPVGAGVGEDVVVCLGDPARRQNGGVNLPWEASIAAIVDRVEITAKGQRPMSYP